MVIIVVLSIVMLIHDDVMQEVTLHVILATVHWSVFKGMYGGMVGLMIEPMEIQNVTVRLDNSPAPAPYLPR